MISMTEGTKQVRIEKELSDILYKDLRFSLIASIYTALLFVYGLSPTAPKNALLAWLAVMIAVSFIRFNEIRKYTTDFSRRSLRHWQKRFRFFVTIAAAVWAFGVYYFFPENRPLYQAYDIFIVAGVTAGGVNSLSTDRISAGIFIGSILMALFFRLLSETSEIYLLEALLTLMFLAVLVFIANRFYHNQRETLEIRCHYKEATEKLAESENRLQIIFDNTPAAVFYYDPDLNLIEANQTFFKMTGLPRDTVHDANLQALRKPEILSVLKKALQKEPFEIEDELQLRDNPPLWIHIKAAAVFKTKTDIIGGIGIMTDVTEHIQTLEAVRHRANYDTLTDLPNRSLLLEKLKESLKHLKRHPSHLALMFLDLDNFKETNDTYGHDIGDKLLIELSRRLKKHLRAEDILARIGGDEFILVMNALPRDIKAAKAAAKTVAEKIIQNIAVPLHINDTTISTGISIGIALTSDHHTRLESLLRNADIAMYRAKRPDSEKFDFFDSETS